MFSSSSNPSNSSSPNPNAFACIYIHCYHRRENGIYRDSEYSFLDSEGRLSVSMVQNRCGFSEENRMAIVNTDMSGNSITNKWKDLYVSNKSWSMSAATTPYITILPIQYDNDALFMIEETYMKNFKSYILTASNGNDELVSVLNPRSFVEFEVHVTEMDGSIQSSQCTLDTVNTCVPPLSQHNGVYCDEKSCGKIIIGTRWKCRATSGCSNFDYCDEHYQIYNSSLQEKQHHSIAPVSHHHVHDFYPYYRPSLPSRLLYAETAIESILNCCSNYGGAPFIGELPPDANLTPSVEPHYDEEYPEQSEHSNARYHPSDRLNQYKWTTFTEIRDEFMSLGTSLHRILPSGSFFGLYAPNCPQWVAADIACSAYGIVSVAVHSQYSVEIVQDIIQKTGMKAVLIKATTQLQTILRIKESWIGPELFPLQFVLAIDYQSIPNELIQIAVQKDLYVLDYHYFVSLSAAIPPDPLLFPYPESISSIVYTSGSTGSPKGSIFTERLQKQSISKRLGNMKQGHNIILQIYPFAWMTGRDIMRSAFAYGHSLVLYSGHTNGIMAEYKRIAPTSIIGVPAIWNQLFIMYKEFVQLKTDLNSEHEKTIRNKSHHNSSSSSTSGYEKEAELWEQYLAEPGSTSNFSQYKFPFLDEFRLTHPLGPRLKLVVIGGASANAELISFLRNFFHKTSFFESYGTTEAGGLMVDGVLLGHSQGKLVDLPELGYLSADKPFPRGELAIKNDLTIPGYYNDPVSTASKFTQDGYFRTGDVVEQITDRTYRIIDRSASFFKISNGEFISPEYLEGIYSKSLYVDQAVVYGDSTRMGVVAIVVPNQSQLQKLLHDMSKSSSTDDSTLNINSFSAQDFSSSISSFHPVLSSLIRADISRICKISQLIPSQFPLSIHIVTEPFTRENGMLTVTSKLSRLKVIQNFKKEIEEMYKQFDSQYVIHDSVTPSIVTPSLSTSSVEPSSASSTTSIFSGLTAIMSRVLNMSHEILSNSVDLGQLGISSVDAVRIVQTVKTELGVSIPVQLLLDNSASNNPISISKLSEFVNPELGPMQYEQENKYKQENILVDMVMSDMELDLFSLPDESCDLPMSLSQLYASHAIQSKFTQDLLVSDQTYHIILTGVTGFLGGQLLLALLSSDPHVVIHCLVRPNNRIFNLSEPLEPRDVNYNDNIALVKTRVTNSIKSRDLWNSAFAERILVYPSHLELPFLGLPTNIYQALSLIVSRIYHSAASVNWILPYSSVRLINVIGTQQIIKFTAKAKQLQSQRNSKKIGVCLVHVSTLGVISEEHNSLNPSQVKIMTNNSNSSNTYTNENHIRRILRRYNSGYNLSKWVAEWLIIRSNSMNIIKNSLIMRIGFIGPNSKTGDFNPNDFLTRYISTVIQSKLYISSTSIFDMMSVDHIAEHLLAISHSQSSFEILVHNISSNSILKLQNPHSWPPLTYEIIGMATTSTLPIENQPKPCNISEFIKYVQHSPTCSLYPLLDYISSVGFFQDHNNTKTNDSSSTSASLSFNSKPDLIGPYTYIQRVAKRIIMKYKKL
jgi:thioester reductase-like protein